MASDTCSKKIELLKWNLKLSVHIGTYLHYDHLELSVHIGTYLHYYHLGWILKSKNYTLKNYIGWTLQLSVHIPTMIIIRVATCPHPAGWLGGEGGT